MSTNPSATKSGATLLRATNLAKSFKSRKVVNDVSFQVESGEVVGLLGPNGAGKNNQLLYDSGLNPYR